MKLLHIRTKQGDDILVNPEKIVEIYQNEKGECTWIRYQISCELCETRELDVTFTPILSSLN